MIKIIERTDNDGADIGAENVTPETGKVLPEEMAGSKTGIVYGINPGRSNLMNPSMAIL